MTEVIHIFINDIMEENELRQQDARRITDPADVPGVAFQFMDLSFQNALNGMDELRQQLRNQAQTAPDQVPAMMLLMKDLEDTVRTCELSIARVAVSQHAATIRELTTISGLLRQVLQVLAERSPATAEKGERMPAGGDDADA